jgi:5,10-methylene-tetrahydrofolate dehydrogenase/methenyl tetrahydrofolate cyclohydrolase
LMDFTPQCRPHRDRPAGTGAVYAAGLHCEGSLAGLETLVIGRSTIVGNRVASGLPTSGCRLACRSQESKFIAQFGSVSQFQERFGLFATADD